MNKQISRTSKPVIAAVQGHALAGGLSLVQACDLAVANRQSRFGLPELKAGLFPMLALAVMEKGLPKKNGFLSSSTQEKQSMRRRQQSGG